MTPNKESNQLKVTMIEIDTVISQLELLQDSQRVKIYCYILKNGQATTNDLIRLTEIQRSTLSYHLTKMVETGILTVSSLPTGRFKKFYSLPSIDRLKLNIDFEEVFKSQDIDLIKKYMLLVYLEYRFFCTLAEISNNVIQTEAIKIIGFDSDQSLRVKINNKQGFIPRTWKGTLTEKQALYVEKKMKSLIIDALENYPSELDDADQIKYNILLGQYPMFW